MPRYAEDGALDRARLGEAALDERRAQRLDDRLERPRGGVRFGSVGLGSRSLDGLGLGVLSLEVRGLGVLGLVGQARVHFDLFEAFAHRIHDSRGTFRPPHAVTAPEGARRSGERRTTGPPGHGSPPTAESSRRSGRVRSSSGARELRILPQPPRPTTLFHAFDFRPVRPLLRARCVDRLPSPAPHRTRTLPTDRADLEATLEALYDAFCFDAGGEADWKTLRSLFAEGATFYPAASPGTVPVGQDADAFFADFASWIRDTEVGTTGLHERIVHTRLDAFGGIAHAWVTFDAFVPGSPPDRRGVDSLQLVRTPSGWRVASFTTQYETPGLQLPQRFASGSDGRFAR